MPTLYLNDHSMELLNEVRDHMTKEFGAVWKNKDEIDLDTAIQFLYNAWEMKA